MLTPTVAVLKLVFLPLISLNPEDEDVNTPLVPGAAGKLPLTLFTGPEGVSAPNLLSIPPSAGGKIDAAP